jgi:hypothetical protein
MPLSNGRAPTAAPVLSIKAMYTGLLNCARTCDESWPTDESTDQSAAPALSARQEGFDIELCAARKTAAEMQN